ncbi:hypothetical protein BJX61DRAFT_542345 [Aspergillus egyptiacus]|nr:hypothetical protein BJX61DRAFT_542345 [Aspergillus egyptiacus]
MPPTKPCTAQSPCPGCKPTYTKLLNTNPSPHTNPQGQPPYLVSPRTYPIQVLLTAVGPELAEFCSTLTDYYTIKLHEVFHQHVPVHRRLFTQEGRAKSETVLCFLMDLPRKVDLDGELLGLLICSLPRLPGELTVEVREPSDGVACRNRCRLGFFAKKVAHGDDAVEEGDEEWVMVDEEEAEDGF